MVYIKTMPVMFKFLPLEVLIFKLAFQVNYNIIMVMVIIMFILTSSIQ